MPGSFFSRFRKPRSGENSRNVIVVSGLPRSGTSMMMKMLEAGGIAILTDHLRQADSDNPKGYYEYERVKKLREGDTAWVPDAAGKAVKVISALLKYLPAAYSYNVIFMMRQMDEILASQKRMLVNRQEASDKVSDEEMAALFESHLDDTVSWLADQKNIRTLYINYNIMLSNPDPNVEFVADFLELSLDIAAMKDTVDPNLYRQRGVTG